MPKPTINVQSLLREAFFSEWSRLMRNETGIPRKTARFLLEAEMHGDSKISRLYQLFSVEQVQIAIDHYLQEKVATEFSERSRMIQVRYHTTNLKYLSRRYAQILYLRSNAGNNLSLAVLTEAQRELKAAGPCDIYPCHR